MNDPFGTLVADFCGTLGGGDELVDAGIGDDGRPPLLTAKGCPFKDNEEDE